MNERNYSPLPEILIPGRDPGLLAWPGSPSPTPTLQSAPEISAIIACSSSDMALNLHRFVRIYRDFWAGKSSIAFPSFPVVALNLRHTQRLTTVDGRLFLSGAAALRTVIKLDRNEDGVSDKGEFEESLAARRKHSVDSILPEIQEPLERIRALPFVIEAKNFYNFYHFSTESLIYLQMVRDYELTGPIYFISCDKTSRGAFVENLVNSLYPDLASRIQYHQGSFSCRKAILPYTSNFLYHCVGPNLMADIESSAWTSGSKDSGSLRPALIENLRTIFRNSFDQSLESHRRSVGARALGRNSAGGERIYIGRRTRPGARIIEGEAALIAMLERRGFKIVYLEDHDPLNQAKICATAHIVISTHGAGFANMMHAQSDAWWVEISHMQAARHRFGDFNMHAAVSGARYLHVFVDHASGEDGNVPPIGRGLSGPKISSAAVDRMEGLVAIIEDPKAHQTFLAVASKLLKADPQAALEHIMTRPDYLHGCVETGKLLATILEYLGDQSGALSTLKKALSIAPYRQDVVTEMIRLSDETGQIEYTTYLKGVADQYRMFRWMRWTRSESGAILMQDGATAKSPESSRA